MCRLKSHGAFMMELPCLKATFMAILKTNKNNQKVFVRYCFFHEVESMEHRP